MLGRIVRHVIFERNVIYCSSSRRTSVQCLLFFRMYKCDEYIPIYSLYRCMLLVHRCVVRMCLFFLGIACVFCRANLCSQCVCLHFDFYM